MSASSHELACKEKTVDSSVPAIGVISKYPGEGGELASMIIEAHEVSPLSKVQDSVNTKYLRLMYGRRSKMGIYKFATEIDLEGYV